MLSKERLNRILQNMSEIKAVLIGDMCLDVYWAADMTKSVLSRETAHFPLPVVSERMSPGAGGNALSDIFALTKNVVPVGVIGNDWRGGCLEQCFKSKGIRTDMLVRDDSRVTEAYIKPMRYGYLGIETEDPRIDFENRTALNAATEEKLIENLLQAVKDADVLCVSDQFSCGCITENVRKVINSLPTLKVVDSRNRIGLYKNAWLKPNEIECARALNLNDDALTNGDEASVEAALKCMAQKTDADICLTLGARGARLLWQNNYYLAEAPKVLGQTDTCGAGDCFLSAFALSLKAGAVPTEAAFIANLASQVNIKKLGMTGSATAEEILARYDEAYAGR